jgi:AraC-like DNA-binding protein
VRCRSRQLESDNQFEPHHHPWGQLAYCARGLLQVTVVHADVSDGERTPVETTTIVPPSRAVWIPPLAQHAVTIVEAAQLLTLYFDPSAVPARWTRSRVLVVSPLLRELVHALDRPLQPTVAVERALLTLLIDEMEQADTQPLGVPMPSASGGDRRLRNLCEAVMQAPAQHTSLAGWAVHAGASERTLARLFREELGTSFSRWRQQVVLAHALPMLARGVSVGRVAEASGYASESAFSAMFKSAMGLAPTRLREQTRTLPQAATASSTLA